MVGELADACHVRGLRSTHYYNRSCNSGDNPAWELSVCYHFVDKCRRAENLLAILSTCGARYDSRLDSW
jgi:hypothetical protein